MASFVWARSNFGQVILAQNVAVGGGKLTTEQLWSTTDNEIDHSDPIKYIFLESFWSGQVKYCIFDDDGPKYLGCGTKYSQWTANIWTIWCKNVKISQNID